MHFEFGWIVVFIIVGLINLYLIYHYFVIPFKSHKGIKRGIALAVHIIMAIFALIYFAKFFSGEAQTPFKDLLSFVAGAYLCMLFYSVGFFFFYDILRIINHFKKFPEKIRHWASKFFYGGLTVFIICILITLSGLYPAQHIVVKDYEATISKHSSQIESLKIAAIADAHIGVTVREEEIVEIKDRINALKPDVIFLVGDIFDEGTSEELKKFTATTFADLKATYGTYFVLGNHDAYTGRTEQQINYFLNADVEVLYDSVALVDNQFYVAGRNDSQGTRADFDYIEAQITEDLPVIVLDHKPEYDEVSKSDKADIQLSGHTHNGQVFPFQSFDIFDVALNYGLHTRGNCQILVTSGVGNYGIPYRIGSPCEIVNLNLSFK